MNHAVSTWSSLESVPSTLSPNSTGSGWRVGCLKGRLERMGARFCSMTRVTSSLLLGSGGARTTVTLGRPRRAASMRARRHGGRLPPVRKAWTGNRRSRNPTSIMRVSGAVDSLGPRDSGTLCCTTAIRWGGALGAVSGIFGFEDDYDPVERGVRAALSRHQGGEYQVDQVSEGLASSWHLATVLFDKGELAAPFVKGLHVANYALMTARDGGTGQVLRSSLETAMEAARLWPEPVAIAPFSNLAEFESKCQEKDIAQALSGDISSLVSEAEKESQTMRSIVQAWPRSGPEST